MRLDIGTHEVEVTGAGLTESQGGTPGIIVYFKNEHGDMDTTMWVTEKTAVFVSKNLTTLGFDTSLLGGDDWLSQLENVGATIKGNRVKIVCDEETYQGKTEVKVKWINDATRVAAGSSKQRLAALLSGKPAGLVSAPRRQEPPPSAPLTDDDLPF